MTGTRPLRIAIDGRKLADFGIGTYIRGLLSGLGSIDDPGVQYMVIAPAASRSLIPASERFAHIEDDAPLYSIRELITIGRLARQHRADLLHVPHYVVPFTDIPIVTTIHDLIHLRLSSSKLPFGARSYARWMIGRAVRKSRHLITPSNAVRIEIIEEFGRAESSISATPLGVDTALYRTEASEAPPLGLADRRYFLFVGNDKPHKNLDRLVEAFRRVHQTSGDLRLVIVGVEVTRHASTAGVINPGFVPEAMLASLYRHALALVLPSHLEGFGLPVLEAMASGTATVVSDIPALRELADGTGLTVDPNSTDSIEEALRLLAHDHGTREASARSGLERSAAYRWETCARKTLAIYRSVLAAANGKELSFQ